MRESFWVMGLHLSNIVKIGVTQIHAIKDLLQEMVIDSNNPLMIAMGDRLAMLISAYIQIRKVNLRNRRNNLRKGFSQVAKKLLKIGTISQDKLKERNHDVEESREDNEDVELRKMKKTMWKIQILFGMMKSMTMKTIQAVKVNSTLPLMITRIQYILRDQQIQKRLSLLKNAINSSSVTKNTIKKTPYLHLMNRMKIPRQAFLPALKCWNSSSRWSNR